MVPPRALAPALWGCQSHLMCRARPSTNAREALTKGNTKEIGGHLDSEVAAWCSGHGPG